MTRTGGLIAAVALLAGCSSSGSGNSDLDSLRRVTEPYKSFAAASAACYSTRITNCMIDTSGQTGAMGYHYGNTTLIDGSVSVTSPELLLYEPDATDTLRLVAVEYIIPYTAHARSDTPPVLFGQQFSQNDVFQLWGLHVWAWKDNPNGLYASWNPNVTCAHATSVTMMAHNH